MLMGKEDDSTQKQLQLVSVLGRRPGHPDLVPTGRLGGRVACGFQNNEVDAQIDNSVELSRMPEIVSYKSTVTLLSISKYEKDKFLIK